MNREDIIRMAREAGMDYLQYISPEAFEKVVVFSKQIAQHEREACADVCKKQADVYAGLEGNPAAKSAWAACIDNRDAIRSRG
jgi:hypothetical protein